VDGLLTFFSSHHAIRADTVLCRAGLDAELIPGPKDLSPNCGTAVRFQHTDLERVRELLDDAHVEVDRVHQWTPATDGWTRPARRHRR
jgi:hypothetical protein